ncbi:hypothetical protein BCIN_10g00760 [Botrytis cinerea B05.10]|uniref:Uncharacterized protein n=1 Tax=Botryotinia fuckeliana (strain B05.10) TaxID=332648 RepID=A0A384JUK6_BOTFB|nr:hypothetical protein BCIN_10g00760 [Botrytis cinerea B05.10]ATZ54054.1 hypothetical protein BCIN_10g00760 [Botrytis cinerea B05.10]
MAAASIQPDYSAWQEEQAKRLEIEDLLARKEQEIPIAGGLSQGSLVSLDMKRDEWAAVMKVIVDAINEHGRIIDDAGIQFISEQCIIMRDMIVEGHQQSMSYRAKGRVWRGLRNRSEQYILEFRRATQYYFTNQKQNPDQDMDPAIFQTAVADWHAAITTTLRVLREALGEEESQREAEDVEYDSDNQEPVINLRRNHSTPQQFSKLVQEVIEMVELAKTVAGSGNASSSYDRRVQKEYIRTQEALKEVSERMEKLEKERRDFFMARGTRPPDQDCAREVAEIERLDKELKACREKLEELTNQCRQQTEYIDAVARGLKPASDGPKPGVLLSDQAFDELCKHFESYHENAAGSEARNKQLEESLRNVILHPDDKNKQELDKKLRAEITAANQSLSAKTQLVEDLRLEIRQMIRERADFINESLRHTAALKTMTAQRDNCMKELAASEARVANIVKVEAAGAGTFSEKEKTDLEQQLRAIMDENMLHEKNIHLCKETIKDLNADIAAREAKIKSLTVMLNFDDDINKNRQEKQDLREKIIALEHYIDNELARQAMENYVSPDDPDDPDDPKDPKDKADITAQRAEIARLKKQLETESQTAKTQIENLAAQLQTESKTANPELAKFKKQLADAINERHQTLLQTNANRDAAKKESEEALAKCEARRIAAEKELNDNLQSVINERNEEKKRTDAALASADAALARANVALKKSDAAFTKLDVTLAKSEARVAELKVESDDIIAKAEVQRAEAKKESDTIIADLRITINELRKQITAINSVNIGLRTTMQEQIDALTKENKELKEREPAADAANGPLSKALDDLENRDLRIALLDDQISDASIRHEQQIKDIQARLDEARLNANGISPQGLRALRRTLADCRKNHDDDQITITNLEAELDACMRRGQHQLRQLTEYAGLHQHDDGGAAARERIAELELENTAIEEELKIAKAEREQKAEEDRKKAAVAHQKELDDAAGDVDIDIESVASHDSNEEINKQHIERLRRQAEDLKKLKNQNLDMEIQLNVSKRTVTALQAQRKDLQDKLRECRKHTQELAARQTELEPGAPDFAGDNSQRITELEAQVSDLEARIAAAEETSATLQLQRDAAIAENEGNKQEMADLQTAHDIMAGEGPKLGLKRIKTRIALQAKATKARNIAARQAQQEADDAAAAKKVEDEAKRKAAEQAKKDAEKKPDDHNHGDNQPPPPPPPPGAGAGALAVAPAGSGSGNNEAEKAKKKKKKPQTKKEKAEKEKAEKEKAEKEKAEKEKAEKEKAEKEKAEKEKKKPQTKKEKAKKEKAEKEKAEKEKAKKEKAEKEKKAKKSKGSSSAPALTPINEEEEEEEDAQGLNTSDFESESNPQNKGAAENDSDSDAYFQIAGYSAQPRKSSFISKKPASRPRVTFDEKKDIVEPEIEQEDESDEEDVDLEDKDEDEVISIEDDTDELWDDTVDLEPAKKEADTTKAKKSLKRASPLSSTRSGRGKRGKRS